MRTVRKDVFYCDHCKLRRLSRIAMEKHERHCTMNPQRTCRWVIDEKRHDFDIPRLASALRENAPLLPTDIQRLRVEVEGCPACMLAALRQSGVEYHYNYKTSDHLFNYKEEVEKFRREEREAADYAEMRAIESSWL